MTREPTESIAFIYDRMPVMLKEGAKDDWLNLHFDAREVIRAAVKDVVYRMA